MLVLALSIAVTLSILLFVFAFVFFVTCKYTTMSHQKAYDDFWFYSMLSVWVAICIYGISLTNADPSGACLWACFIISILFYLIIQLRNWMKQSKIREERPSDEKKE